MLISILFYILFVLLLRNHGLDFVNSSKYRLYNPGGSYCYEELNHIIQYLLINFIVFTTYITDINLFIAFFIQICDLPALEVV